MEGSLYTFHQDLIQASSLLSQEREGNRHAFPNSCTTQSHMPFNIEEYPAREAAKPPPPLQSTLSHWTRTKTSSPHLMPQDGVEVCGDGEAFREGVPRFLDIISPQGKEYRDTLWPICIPRWFLKGPSRLHISYCHLTVTPSGHARLDSISPSIPRTSVLYCWPLPIILLCG